MKKLMLIATTASILSFSSLACAEEGVSTDSGMSMSDSCYYIRIDGGASLFGKVKINPSKDSTEKVKFKVSPIVSAGVGYYLMDNVRAEVNYIHPFDPQTKKKKCKDSNSSEDNKHSVKYNIHSVMAKAYYDMFEAGPAKFFVGGGLGAAMNKVKVSPVIVKDEKIKSKLKLAYTLAVGASCTLTEKLTGQVEYSWIDLGKVARDYGKFKARGHSLTAGIRFDI